MNLDYACDIYKDRKENPELYPKHRWLKTAQNEYERALGEPPMRRESYIEAKRLLERNDL